MSSQLIRLQAPADTPSARAAQPPVLWHLKVSNYNEKARWALDHKQIRHVRRAAIPGQHHAIARKLSGGQTFPVLIIDGEAIGDSTAIIEALEQRYPQPPLYPSDPADLRQALELEEFFDEQLGPYARHLFVHHALPDPKLMLGAFVPDLRGTRYLIARGSYPAVRRRVRKQFQINDETVAEAYGRLAIAGRRFRASKGPGDYLVADRFTVADLTLAALLAPMVAPPQFPYPQPQRDHPRLARMREALDRHGLLEWTREMYARHRPGSAAVSDIPPGGEAGRRAHEAAAHE